MKFTVDRKTWIRGIGGKSMLFRPQDGHMCCLGFLARAIGFGIYHIEPAGVPEGIRCNRRYASQEQQDFINFNWVDIVSKNDCPLSAAHIVESEWHREELLKKLFLDAGHEVEFVG